MIRLIQTDRDRFNSFSFTFEDRGNNIKNLISSGTKTNFNAQISNTLQPAAYTMNLQKGDISLCWKKVRRFNDKIKGYGYIEINKRIDFICADSIWTGQFSKPGDSEYRQYFDTYCSPPDIYMNQSIWFEID